MKKHRLKRSLAVAMAAALGTTIAVPAAHASTPVAPDKQILVYVPGAPTCPSTGSIDSARNTATARLRDNAAIGCQIGVRSRWRPPGAPATPPYFTMAWRWSGTGVVSQTTQPNIVGASRSTSILV